MGLANEDDVAAWLAAREPSLRRFAIVLTGPGPDAEDLVQVTLARVYMAWGRLEDRGRLDAYARRVMVNEHRSRWRRLLRRRETLTSEPPDTAVCAVRPDVRDDRLWQAVRDLPTRQRAALALRYYEELTEAETAEVLGCTVGTVKSQTSRALAKLRTTLTPDQIEEEQA